jgi:hypothetical protein
MPPRLQILNTGGWRTPTPTCALQQRAAHLARSILAVLSAHPLFLAMLFCLSLLHDIRFIPSSVRSHSAFIPFSYRDIPRVLIWIPREDLRVLDAASP